MMPPKALRPGFNVWVNVSVIQAQDREQFLWFDPVCFSLSVMEPAQRDDVLQNVVSAGAAGHDMMPVQSARTTCLVQKPIKTNAVTPASLRSDASVNFAGSFGG
jgi:hypothetical protein